MFILSAVAKGCARLQLHQGDSNERAACVTLQTEPFGCLATRQRIRMETKIKFRDELKSFVSKKLEIDIDKLDTMKRSKVMTRFYAETIRRVFNPVLIPADQDDLEHCIIDGADDCGVDFLSRGDGSVLIIQAKFRGYGVHEKLEDVVSFAEVLRRIHPETGKKYKKNQKLTEALSEVDWDNDTFQLVFITLGRFGENLRTKEDEGPTLGAELKDRCELTLAEESDLNMELREALSAGETIAEPIRLTFLPSEGETPWIKLSGPHGRSTYVGFVRGTEIAEVYRPHTHRFRLFALNIRDWIGETSTNKGILTTAETRPDDFLFFNNGISAVASSIEENEEKAQLSCKNFSIINGAQTVRSLFRAQAKNPDSAKKTTVLFRVSTFSLGKEIGFLEDLTRYNNTQNKISVSDFRSNDPVQRDLAKRFGELKRGGSYFWYKNKRSREKRERIPIEMEEFAKTIHAFRYGPHDMWGGTARLFDTSKDGRYAWVFGDGEATWAVVPEDEFQLLCGIWFLCEEIRALWKGEKDRRTSDETAGSALERRYTVYYAVAELLRMVYADDLAELKEHLRKLGKPKWTERDGHEKATIKELTKLAFSGLIKAYETASHAPDFRHRNWFRDKSYLDGIRSELRFIKEIRSSGSQTLPLLVSQ